MLFWLISNVLVLHSSDIGWINDLSIRAVVTFFSGLLITLGIGSFLIIWLSNLHIFQIIRMNGPKLHILKQGTPTMGGIIMLISVIISVMVWSDLSNKYVWCVLFILVMYGMLGIIDDWLKIKKMNTVGLSASQKYFWQSLIALIVIIIVNLCNNDNNFAINSSMISYIVNVITQLSIWNILLAYFVIVGTSNAVNVSDGLDGLVIVPIILIALGLALISWATDHMYVSNYFHLSYLYDIGELAVVCAAISGSGLGFLWFNTYPAQIFMGDVGSLSFGGALGLIAVLLKQEFLLFIMGGVLVVEVLSVIFQVVYFKCYKRRIFYMAPIHHHFELKGYSEPKIVVRFWIISLILVILGLFILRIR